MEIKTWIKYYEGYLPPRCRKLRYRECEDYVDITLAEATLTDMSLAFEDNSYEGKGKIYYYDGRLWAADSSFNRGFHKYKSALEKIIDENANCSWYFPRIWRDGEHPDARHVQCAHRPHHHPRHHRRGYGRGRRGAHGVRRSAQAL